jgi:hypothetical protein
VWGAQTAGRPPAVVGDQQPIRKQGTGRAVEAGKRFGVEVGVADPKAQAAEVTQPTGRLRRGDVDDQLAREWWAARGDVAERLSAKRGGVSTAELERVAEVYSNHRDNKPVQAVQMLVGYASRRTASRRIQQARQVGFLTPAGTAEATAEDQAPALKAPMRLPSTPQEVEDQIARYEEQGRPDLAAGLLELRQAMQRKETD